MYNMFYFTLDLLPYNEKVRSHAQKGIKFKSVMVMRPDETFLHIYISPNKVLVEQPILNDIRQGAHEL